MALREVVIVSLLLFRQAFSQFDEDRQKKTFKFMTFNTWNFGKNVDDGIIKIANHIIVNDPDVVALQEVESERDLLDLLKILGSKWNAFYPVPSKVATLIYNNSYTKTFTGHGVKIFVDEVNPITVFNVQFEQKPFTPEEIAANGFDEEVVELFEKNKKRQHGRYNNLKELLNDEFFLESLTKTRVAPVILAGDLHSPSHLDWVEATNILSQQTAMVDTFRYVNSDPLMDSGYTYSTVEEFMDGSENKLPEPKERIDYIFARGPHLKPISSKVYPEKFNGKTLPYVKDNHWPSDHYAVITEFVWNL